MLTEPDGAAQVAGEGSPASPGAGYRGLLDSRLRVVSAAAGAIARLPLAGAGVAIVLAVGSATGSYGAAGTASAAYVITAAAIAPVLGRRMDRRGQRGTLLLAAMVQVGAFCGLWWAASARSSSWLLVALSAMAGAGGVDIGSVARSRWATVTGEGPQRRTAFMLESVIDETMFVVTAPIATGVAAWRAEAAPLAIAFGPAVGGLLLAVTASPAPTQDRNGRGPRARTPLGDGPELRGVVFSFMFLGAFLGSIEVLLIALAMHAGHPVSAGLALSGWAVGSVLTALAAGPTLNRFAPATVLVLGTAVMSGFCLLLPAGDAPWWTITICLLAGAGASPAISAGYTLAGESAGAERRTEGLTWASTGLGIGTTCGAALAGILADRIPTATAYVLPSILGLLTLASTEALRRSRAGTGQPRPAAGRTRSGTTGDRHDPGRKTVETESTNNLTAS